jgi:hypothetical protein
MCSATTILFLGGYLYPGAELVSTYLLPNITTQYGVVYFGVEGLLYGVSTAIK